MMSTGQPFKQAESQDKLGPHTGKWISGYLSVWWKQNRKPCVLCMESSAPKKDNEMARRLPKHSHHDVKDKRAEPASWLAAVSWQLDQPRALQHWWELSSTQRLEKSNSSLWLPAFSCWRQHLEAGQPWTSSTAQGQASHSKTERKGLLELVTKGSSWWDQEFWGTLAPRQHKQEGAAIVLMTLLSLVGRLQVTPGVSTTMSLTRSLEFTVRGLNWAKCFSYLKENSN